MDIYPSHFHTYIQRVRDGDIVDILRQQGERVASALMQIPAEQADHRYEVGKWSVREVIGHMSDTERIMAYRMLRIARGDATPLAGFDDEAYVTNASFGRRSIPNLVEEMRSVRAATVTLAAQLDETAWTRIGTASGHQISALAQARMIAGHELHHLALLRERYGLTI